MGRTKSRGNGQGTAFRLRNGWNARVVVGWKPSEDGSHFLPIYKSKSGFATKREALEYCPVLMASAAEKKKEAPRLYEYWDIYYEGEYQKLSGSKQTAYRIAWTKLKPLHHTRVSVITVEMLRSVVSSACATFYPARDCKTVLTALFLLAAADGYANKDLPSFIVLPKLEEKERQPFTDMEQAALWKAYEAGCKNAAIPLIMIYTGMMTGEMRRLTVDMIDYEKKQIVGVGMKTKVRKEATVFLPSTIIPVLQDVSAGSVGRVWTCNEDDFYARYYAALETAGVRRLTPYSCRHTTATALAINENIAPQTIRKLMRWSTTKMLDRYAHPSNADAATAIESLRRQGSSY